MLRVSLRSGLFADRSRVVGNSNKRLFQTEIYGGPQLSRQNLFRHGKIILATAKSFSSRPNLFRHGKIILATAKSFSSRQNHFGHGKIFFVTAKSFWPRQNHFQPRQNHFCTHVTFVRKVLWRTTNSQLH